MTGLRSFLFPVLLCAACACSGGLIGYGVAPHINAPPTDFLDDCYAADRASKVTIIRAAAKQSFRTPSDARQWFIDQSRPAIERDFKPLSDAVGEAIVNGTLEELAGRLGR